MQRLWVILFLIACAQVSAEEVVSFTQETALEALRRGDRARDRRQWADAVQSYRAAGDMYRVLARNAPDWEQDYFRFRLQTVDREVGLIERQTGRSQAEWLEEPLFDWAAHAEQFRILYVAVSEENRILRERIAALEEEIDLLIELEEIDARRRHAPESAPDFDPPEVTTVPAEPVWLEPIPVQETRPVDAAPRPRAWQRDPSPQQPVPRR